MLLGGSNGLGLLDDDRISAEELILNGHLECVKEEA